MNHCVPDFEIRNHQEEDYPIHISNKPSMQNDEIMELLWQNGQVVVQSQNQRPPLRKPPPARNSGVIPARGIRAENYNSQHLFMEEHETASWLHGSIDEDPDFDHRDFCADIFCQPPGANGGQNHSGVVQAPARAPPAATRPPIPPERAGNRVQNFTYFSKHIDAKGESVSAAARELTVVDSCETPIVTAAAASRLSETVRSSPESGRGTMSAAGIAGPSTGTFDLTVTSSPGGSSGSAEPDQREPVVDRKRKSRELEESEFQSEDVDFESPEAKKQGRRAKKSRAAEIHNLSERKRRDRINEKMRALQELIPRCNKSDKASMLDEAIEYLKSLQLQVQMMSMGCGMVPMMFPGMQQYMPPMGMGMGMGMGMEMGMGMNRPVMPFPNMLAANSALPAAAAAAHLGPRFPVPPFHNIPHVPAAPDSSRTQQPPNQSGHMLNSFGTLPPDQSRIPNFTDPYQQYLGPHQVQIQLMQAMNQLNVSKPSTSRGQENPEKHQSEET